MSFSIEESVIPSFVTGDTRPPCAAARTAGEETKGEDGLVYGHAYTVIECREVAGGPGGTVRLMRVRNPWGSFEWNGDWSDSSKLWDKYPRVKETIDPSLADDDGEFWMDFRDFQVTTVARCRAHAVSACTWCRATGELLSPLSGSLLVRWDENHGFSRCSDAVTVTCREMPVFADSCAVRFGAADEL